MTSTFKIQALDLDEVEASSFDLMICALGYESRSRYFAERFSARSRRRIAIEFDDRKVLSYSYNKQKLLSMGFDILQCADLFAVLAQIYNDVGLVLVDITSMSRPMLARVLLALENLASSCASLKVSFIYCIAEYYPIDPEGGPVTFSGPVIPEFAGWNPEVGPLNAIVGLGYEIDHAVGALEDLETVRSFLFVPTSPDRKFDKDIDDMLTNKGQKLRERCLCFSYDVVRPAELFFTMESLVSGLLSRGERVVVMPFGPKIFSAVAMLVARSAYPRVMIKRISGDVHQTPVDKYPSGFSCCFKAIYG